MTTGSTSGSFCADLFIYYQEKVKAQTESTNQDQDNVRSLGISSEAKKIPSSQSDTTLGHVWVSDSHQPICIPANSAKVVSGKTNKITKCLTSMVGSRKSNNLPMGVVVNRTMVTPNKSKHIPILLINTNSYNLWFQQPLLAADVIEAKHCTWDYQFSLSCKGNEVKVTFHPIPTPEVQEEILSSAVNNSEASTNKSDQISRSVDEGERPRFRSQPKFNDPNFDFQAELKRLPFPINLGEVDMSKAQQIRFLELIYNNQAVFSLCGEDLGLWNCLKCTIPTTTDKPVY